MHKIAIAMIVCIMGVMGFAVAVALADPPPGGPPGQGDCEHGNSQKPCKDDPQPDHGQDCDQHGPGEGGVNEDHCLPDETTTTTDTTTTTTTTDDDPPDTTTTTNTTTTNTTTTGGNDGGILLLPNTTTIVTPEDTTPVPPLNGNSATPEVTATSTSEQKVPPVCPVGKPATQPCAVQGNG